MPTRDSEFYFETVIFLVEDTLFRVPKHHFADIDVFSTIFTLPNGGKLVEGSSDDNPFYLSDIKKEDFRAFLVLVYPSTIASARQLTEEQWVSVLKLASLWQSEPLRKLCIENLNAILDKSGRHTSRITYGYQYDVPDWVISGYTALARRHKGLSKAEAEELGAQGTRIVYEIRETTFTGRSYLNDYPARVALLLDNVSKGG